MQQAVGQIRYENVHSFVREMKFDERVGREMATGFAFIHYDDPGDINAKAGDTITLETSNALFNGVFPVLEVGDNRSGYKYLKVDFTGREGLSKGGLPLWFRLADMAGLTGRIYFGRRNVKAANGGLATQVLNNDLYTGLLALGIFIAFIGGIYQFFSASE